MSDQEIKINLCYYDPENPNSNLDAYEDEDRPQPRNECGCDNCFYGRDKLAMQLIEAKRERDEAMELLASEKITRNHIIKRSVEVERERDEAREKAERYRREANKFMLQRDEARESLKHISEYGTDEINAAVELRQKLVTALVERDDALGALMKIEDLFIDGTDIYADRENMGLIARAALEEIK
jgi:hypothetical protein